MKTKLKRILTVLLASVAFLSCTGCSYLFALQSAREKYQADQMVTYVAFSKDGEEGDPMDYLEIAEYRSVYDAYNSRVMYDTLKPEEQLIYRFFEYALDHSYTTVFIDSRLLVNVDLELEDILKIYSMDTAMVQQNYSYSSQDTSYTFSYMDEMFQFEISGTVFAIDRFTPAALEKKKQAIEAAKDVFAAMPPNLSQLEQARYFYQYLVTHVQYFDSDAAPNEQDNLYDAFVLKKTQCDGFANAFALLCSMAKIPCVEKVFTPEQKEEKGHTWNAFCADGVWYNADMALTDDYAESNQELGVDFKFGYSDGRQTFRPDLAQRCPPCNTNLLMPDLTLSSPADPNMLKSTRNAFRETENDYVLICLEEGELSENDLQKIADYLKSDIFYQTEIWEGKNYYFIFRK